MNSFVLKKYNWIWFLLLLIFIILIRLPTFELPIDNDSGSFAYHGRLILQGEPLYGTHHPGHHLPGIFYTYALIFKILGDSPNSLQIVLIFWMWLNGLVLIKIGEALSSFSGGVLAAIFFAFISSMPNLLGDTTIIELFANLPISIVIWLATLLYTNKKTKPIFILIGVFSAISFLFKAVYLQSFAAVGIVLTVILIFNKKESKWFEYLRGLCFIFIGWALILVPIFLYFYFEGLLPRLFLVFQIGAAHATEFPWYFIFILPFLMLYTTNLFFMLMGLLGLIKTLIYYPKHLEINKKQGFTQYIVMVWGALAIFVAGFSRCYFPHYALLIIPPLSLLASVETNQISYRLTQIFRYPTNFKKNIISIIIAFVVIGNSLSSSSAYWEGYINYRLRKISLTEFVSNHTPFGKINLIAQEIALYIEQNSNPQETILTSTQLAQISYIANRRSSLDILWPSQVSFLGNPERAFDLNPVYVVVGPPYLYDNNIRDWLFRELSVSYELEITIDQYDIYRIIDDT